MNLRGIAKQLLLFWLIGVTASALVTYLTILLVYPVLVPFMIVATVSLGAFAYAILKLAKTLEQKIYEIRRGEH